MTANTIARAYKSSDKTACLAIFDSNTPPYFDESERPLFSTFLDAPNGTYLVVEYHGQIVGCGGIAREDDGTTITFTWGMVRSDHHGLGLGRFLSEARLQRIKTMPNVGRVQLNTTPQVRPFFEHMGFHQTAYEKDGYAPGMDKVTMEKPA